MELDWLCVWLCLSSLRSLTLLVGFTDLYNHTYSESLWWKLFKNHKRTHIQRQRQWQRQRQRRWQRQRQRQRHRQSAWNAQHMLYFWNPDYSLIPNMMIDTSPWSPCSRRSPWSPWLLSSVHAIRSTGPNVSLDQPHKHENMIIWCKQLGHSFHLFHSVSYWQTVLAVDETFCGKKVFFPKKKLEWDWLLKIAELFGVSGSWSIM